MPPGIPTDTSVFRERIAAAAPELRDAPMVVLGDGWDSVALDVADRFIFKFPRTEVAAASLRREYAILRLVRSRVRLPVPELELHQDTGGVFSQHLKLPGAMLQPDEYPALSPGQQRALAEVLAQFYADVHQIPVADAKAAGARPVGALIPAETIRAALREGMPDALVPFLETTLDALSALPPDRTVFGQFDGHGWNMAFDHATGRLNGLYDFADAAIGPLHRDLSYTCWINPQLCRDVTRIYAGLTGYPADPAIAVLHNSVLRLSEHADGTLAQVVDDPHAALAAHWELVRRPGG